MTLDMGSRRRGATIFVSATAALVASTIAIGIGPSTARASALNVVTAMTTSVAPGTEPVDSLPNAYDQTGPSPGTQYTPPTSTSTTPPAGGDDDFTESLTFGYGGDPASNSPDGSPDQTVQTVDLTLPPGVLDSLAAVSQLCTPSELGTMPVATSSSTTTDGTGWMGAAPGNEGCPSDAQIGEVAGTAEAVGSPIPITGNLYLMAPTSPDDVASIGVEADANVFGLWSRVQVASGPIRFALSAGGQPELQVALTLPAGTATGDGVVAANGLIAYTLLNLTETINGLSPSGGRFAQMPTSDAATTATTAVTVQGNGYSTAVDYDPATGGHTIPGVSGSGNATITPTGAAALAFAPQLTASVVRDRTDRNVALTTTITQAPGGSASRSITLTLPSDLGPNIANALPALCVNAAAGDSGCAPVGTVTATSPLLATPLTGTLYLTGTGSGVSLDIVFPAPFAITISGAVDLTRNTVTFPSIPDMPLTGLQVQISGGPHGIYETTCSSTTDTAAISAAFTGQNGASATGTAAFTITGCPTWSTTPPPSTGLPSTRPDVALRAAHLSTRRGRLTIRVASRPHTAPIRALRISAPTGISFRRAGLTRRIVVRGARVRSVRLVRGQLVITLRRPASWLTIDVSGAALHVDRSLVHRLRDHRPTRLRLHVVIVTTTDAIETATAVARA